MENHSNNVDIYLFLLNDPVNVSTPHIFFFCFNHCFKFWGVNVCVSPGLRIKMVKQGIYLPPPSPLKNNNYKR